MKVVKFYAHLSAAVLFIDGPLWSYHWSIGVLFLLVIIGFVELSNGLFDDIITGDLS